MARVAKSVVITNKADPRGFDSWAELQGSSTREGGNGYDGEDGESVEALGQPADVAGLDADFA